jgi:hypothetical protein
MMKFNIGILGGIQISTESANDEIFKEYRQLGPKRKSLEHKLVFFLHLAAAVIFFVNQLNNGFGPEFYGNGIVTPILLIINGFAYSYMQTDSWYREEMVPFISRIISITEIESDMYCQYHRRVARFMLIIGWISILVCQWIVNFGFAVFPLFISDDFLIRLVGELVAYGLIFGPYILYFLLLLAIASVVDKFLGKRYKEISHLLEIEMKWKKENARRAKNTQDNDESKKSADINQSTFLI